MKKVTGKASVLIIIKTLYLLPLLTLPFNKTFGQSGFSSQTAINAIVPLSPNAAALGKYGEIPIGYSTGTPSISIPIYDINVKDLALPVSINYHASGIKIDEIASSVGLGWSLNAGGVITRQIRDMPDDNDVTGYMVNADNSYSVTNVIGSSGIISHAELFELRPDFATANIDMEPDIYTFNFGKWSGKFFYHQPTKQFHCISHQKMRINCVSGSAGITSWAITVEDGATYTFTEIETMITHNDCLSIDAPSNITGYKTAWYLTKITSAAHTEEINISYNRVIAHFLMNAPATGFVKLSGVTPPQYIPLDCINTTTFNQTNTVQLSEIKFPGGKLKFIFNQCRKDLNGDKSLDVIEIYKNDVLLKKNIFTYDYFGAIYNASDYCDANYTNMFNATMARLKLRSLSSQSADGSQAVPPYSFTYREERPLPGRLSYQQDYWGYYNGASANSSLIPETYYSQRFFPGANRSPSSDYSQSGILTAIIYPTGGNTNFEYENNTVLNTNASVGQTVSRQEIINKFDLVQNTTKEKQFTINSINGGGAYVTYTYNFQGNCIALYPHCVEMEILNASNQRVLYIEDNATGQTPIYLTNGTYTIRYFTTPNAQVTSFYFSLDWQEIELIPSTGDVIVGGLRVKSIEDVSPDKRSSIRYLKYEIDNASHHTSGNILELPNYTYSIEYISPSGCNCAFDPGNSAYYLIINSYSNYPLASTQGSHCFYSSVIVYQGDEAGTNGKTVYTYLNELNTRYGLSGFPFAPSVDNEHRRGLLYKTSDYKKQDGIFKIAREVTNEYITVSNVIAKGIKIGADKVYLVPHPVGSQYVYQIYTTASDWVRMTSTKERVYDQADNAIYTETTTSYSYDPASLQVSQIAVNNSKGEQVITKLKHPLDYTNAQAGSVVNLMKGDKFMHSAILQKTMLKNNISSGASKLLNSQITQFGSFAGENSRIFIAPQEIALFETTIPLDPENSTVFPSYIPANNYDISKFRKVESYQYDEKGNSVSIQKENDIQTSFIWGYNKKYPIARIVNADPKNVFHTSFEDVEGNSAEGDSKTGKKSRTGGYNKSLSAIANGTYVLTYWQKSGNNWVLQRNNILVDNNAYNINLTGQVDEIRFYSKGAHLTTYTFDVLVGLTSECDINNNVTYYEYDGLQRLVLIRDKDRNIVKRICYNYAGQVETCNPSPRPPLWEITYKYRCVVDGSGHNTGQQEREERDNEPASLTYTQTRWVSNGASDFCPVPAASVNMKISNFTSMGFYATFVNTSTNTSYYFNLSQGTLNYGIGQIPAGTYNITITPSGGSMLYEWWVGNYYTAGYNYLTASGISIGSDSDGVIQIADY